MNRCTSPCSAVGIRTSASSAIIGGTPGCSLIGGWYRSYWLLLMDIASLIKLNWCVRLSMMVNLSPPSLIHVRSMLSRVHTVAAWHPLESFFFFFSILLLEMERKSRVHGASSPCSTMKVKNRLVRENNRSTVQYDSVQ